jgi:hypothetical protein
MRQTEESKPFFLAKKNQKTFVYGALAFHRRARQMAGRFASFFKTTGSHPVDAPASG